ncbi:MAG: hypothetical protein FWE63_01905 [Bacteroidales bacterium]|nr:hypothetical protein [Bacteroidales bacterium]
MKKRILYFDDEDIAETMQKNLELFDFDVILVSTITDFFEKIDSNNVYDLLLMDIMAPVPSSDDEKNKFSRNELSNMEEAEGRNVGEVLAYKITNMPKYSNTPVLFYSARAYVNTERYKKARHIRKPELAETIVEEIKNLLKSE